jgi:hypothetical protein
MAPYTEKELSQRGRQLLAGRNVTAAAVLRHASTSTTDADRFDVFLSHSYSDAEAILGVYNLLSSQGLKVYVDWIVDDQMHRSAVNARTAQRLRKRMSQCLSLIYVTSGSSRSSVWMPWELGYFDGSGGTDRVSIMPLEGSGPGNPGQEYLDLYPSIEKLPEAGRMVTAAVRPDGGRAVRVKEFAMGRL